MCMLKPSAFQRCSFAAEEKIGWTKCHAKTRKRCLNTTPLDCQSPLEETLIAQFLCRNHGFDLVRLKSKLPTCLGRPE
jgi:hypothetical protein